MTSAPAPRDRQSDHPSYALMEYIAQHPNVNAYCVAYSGGRDSHVLLHAAAECLRHRPEVRLRAVHIDHGLHPESAAWAAHCAAVAQQLGVALEVRRVAVEPDGEGVEAAARTARYTVFAETIDAGEHVLLAQHAADQAETFLLQALRGSGPDGLASMPRKRTFGRGIMARPMIQCLPAALERYARTHELQWIEDPSNEDLSFDRNYLRRQIMPLIEARWPAAARTLGRSAMRSAAASHTLLGVAGEDLESVRLRGASELSVSELRALPRERAFNALRLWVRHADLRLPRLQDLSRVLDELVMARSDSVGLVSVRDYEFRRHGDRLYLLPPFVEAKAFEHVWQAPFDDLAIPEIGAVLTRGACEYQGIRLPISEPVIVRSRRGGELIKLGEPAFHKAVKKLLQEAGIPPWQRDRIPLLYVNERLIAVWNVAVAADFRESSAGPLESAASDGEPATPAREVSAAEATDVASSA